MLIYLTAPSFEEEGLPAGTQPWSATYEDLRRKNREEYEQKKSKQFRFSITIKNLDHSTHCT
jgi:hypothetical protein